MKTQAILLCLAVCLMQVSATVTQAIDTADVQQFTQANTENDHTYGLYFTDKDENIFTAMQSLFSEDEDAEF